MARLVFGAAIDYARVRIFRRCYLPFGLQPAHCAMAPNGSIYFHPSCYLPNYAAADASARHWFMHEMTHVWQHQLGYPVRLRGAIRIGLSYAYELSNSATLADFNMEAQGDVLADYFALKFLCLPEVMRQSRYAGQLALYERVLAGFVTDPADRVNLPAPVWRLPRANR
ncbi:MAG: Rhs element Vgr protein [Pseudomonadota bacterium]|nr:Rhs element Vgr protein [Pseudomonadota bacterium]